MGLLGTLLGPMSYFHVVQDDAPCGSGAEEGFYCDAAGRSDKWSSWGGASQVDRGTRTS